MNGTVLLPGEHTFSEPKEFYKIEDRFSKEFSHAQLEQAFLKESAKVRELLNNLIGGKSVDLTDCLYVTLSKMRRIGRLAQYATAQNKADVAIRLQQAEAQYLQLQNVNSEIYHLKKEITRCLQFRSGEESIELASEEDFYSSAPEEVSKPEITKNDEHAKHLARLSFELMQRKQLTCTLDEQEGRRSVLISDINGKEQRLKSLRPKIENLLKAAKPVQDVLELGSES
ncbi:unnamed protein product [Auanema sp. JU1783]|nr:unnamed protein product [Auanema sp. JU1783]